MLIRTTHPSVRSVRSSAPFAPPISTLTSSSAFAGVCTAHPSVCSVRFSVPFASPLRLPHNYTDIQFCGSTYVILTKNLTCGVIWSNNLVTSLGMWP